MSNPNNGDNVLVRFDRVTHETDAATLIEIDGPGVVVLEFWIPKSQTAAIDADAKELWIPLWLAEKKGLSYE